jgi:hypothetical protein
MRPRTVRAPESAESPVLCMATKPPKTAGSMVLSRPSAAKSRYSDATAPIAASTARPAERSRARPGSTRERCWSRKVRHPAGPLLVPLPAGVGGAGTAPLMFSSTLCSAIGSSGRSSETGRSVTSTGW